MRVETRRRAVPSLGLTALLAVGLTACRGGESASAPAGVPPGPAPARVAAPATTPPAVPPPPLVTPSPRLDGFALKLADRLGVERELDVAGVDQKEPVLEWIANDVFYGHALALQVFDGGYLLIPLEGFRRAWAAGGRHVVTLASGAEWRGELSGIVEGRGSGVRYDLAGVRTLLLTGAPGPSQPRRGSRTKASAPGVPAVLDVRGHAGPALELRDPRFWFRYSSGAGYVVGSSTRTTSSASFYLKSGEDEILANLADFAEVSFGRTPGTSAWDEPEVAVKVRAGNGVTTSGTLVLKEKDSDGEHRGGDWYLGGMLGTDGALLAVRRPVGALRRP